METSSIFSIFRRKQITSNLISLFIAFMTFGGCASKPQRPSTTTPAPTVSTQTPPPKIEGPVESQRKPIPEAVRITLVLGGAGVASFATVGLLKRFNEEGVVVERIISTGWPTLFALAHGFLKSVHDVEWFAMRLQEKDFYKAGLFDMSKDYASHQQLSELIQSAFKQKDLGEATTPIVISASNTEIGDGDVFDSGDWREPLLKTMSVPGIYRPYPQDKEKQWVTSLQGMDVEEGQKRGAKWIVAVNMYGDYASSLKSSKKDSSDRLFRQLYLAQLTKSLRAQSKLAQANAEIVLSKTPNDFTAKRTAIQAGYKEGGRIIRQLKALP